MFKLEKDGAIPQWACLLENWDYMTILIDPVLIHPLDSYGNRVSDGSKRKVTFV